MNNLDYQCLNFLEIDVVLIFGSSCERTALIGGIPKM